MKSTENRTREIQKLIRVTAAEKAVIDRKMAEAGMKNFNTFARHMLMTGMVKVFDFKEINGLRYEVNRIGHNINQIARQVNTDDLASLEELTQVLTCVQEVQELISGRLPQFEPEEV